MSKVWVASSMLALVWCAPSAASACGGLFCSSAPVLQRSEAIIYGLEEDGTLTMSVRIEYVGEDDDFAWIVPVPVAPEISLGTDVLFDQLLATTAASFPTSSETEGRCRPHPACEYPPGEVSWPTPTWTSTGGCGGARLETPDAGRRPVAPPPPPPPPPPPDASLSRDAGSLDGGVRVVSQRSVGPYESVVLGAATAAEVVAWLRSHDYDVPESTVPLLEPYAASGQLFVALRLAPNRLTSRIRPVVLRMATDEACLPIRLTPVATIPSLPITAFFLGRAGVTPRNYSVVGVSFDDPALWTGGALFQQRAFAAVTSAGGQAFVTEYSDSPPTLGLTLRDLDDLRTGTFEQLVVSAFTRGYFAEPVTTELLARFAPVPEGWDADSYFTCIASSGGCPPLPSDTPVGRAIDALHEQVASPRRDADLLLARHPVLTRLITSLRREDMTVDPVFVLDDGLPRVSGVHQAVRVTQCDGSHYPEDAPIALRLPEQTVPWTPGRRSDDTAYCDALGLITPGEAARRRAAAPPPPAPPAAPPGRSGCGCGGCVASRAADARGFALVFFGLLWILRARGREQRR